MQWTENKVLDESAQKVFEEAQSQLQFIVAEGSPHMESGCVECPSPCTMAILPIVEYFTLYGGGGKTRRHVKLFAWSPRSSK